MNEKPLRICVVGAGDLGSVHARHWANVPEAQVVAVVDKQAERASRLADELGLDRFYTDYQAAVDRSDVNVVSVCIPTCFHPEVSIYAAGQGKHVFSEKPIALTLEAAEAMQAAARQHKVKFGVGLMRHHSPVMADLKQRITAGQFGRPLLYFASDIREIRPKREMHDRNANGGPIIDMGVHYFETCANLFDAPPVEVFAQGFTFALNRPEIAHIKEKAIDTATITVKYAAGDVATLLLSWGVAPKVVPPPLPEQIIGPNGVVYAAFGPIQHTRWLPEGGEWQELCRCETSMYALEISDFARCILEDRPPAVDGEPAKAALRVALATLESIRAGRPVPL